jgi:hypothetical protein
MNTTVPDRENHNCKHRDVYVQTHKGLLWTSTFTDNHICSHRYAWPCVWTQAHKQTHWHKWEFWLPDCKNAASPQGWLTSALYLHSFEKLKPSQPSWTCFIPLFCTHFQMIKSTGWNLLSRHQTLSVLKIMPEFCPSWRQPLKMLQPALPIPSQ